MDWREPPVSAGDWEFADTRESNVVVVGLGYAGSAALRAASENGCPVIGLEAQRESRYTLFGRDFGHINSRFLASRGVPEVDPLDLFSEWMRRAGNRANPELVMKFCRKCGDAFDWYTDMYGPDGLRDVHVAFWPKGGERFKEAVQTKTNELNGYYFWNGTAEFPDPMGWKGSPTLPACAYANLTKARDRGAELCFGMKARQLLLSEGRVIGVAAEDGEGHFHRFLARKAVILAAGDFSRNAQMVRELCCDYADMLPEEEPVRAMGRDGSGVCMGVWAGGQLESRPIPMMGGNGVLAMGMCSFGSVWFDQNGRRFCNECFGGPELAGFAGNQHPMDELYAVFDEHMLENELTWAVPAHGMFDENIEGLADNLLHLRDYAYRGGAQPYQATLKMPLGKQTCFYGRTPEELVRSAGLSAEVGEELCQGIRHYNEMCAAGRDEDFGRDKKVLDPLTDMLFLQKIPRAAGRMIMVTGGGLLTDGEQRVLGADGKPIPGLLASGNCCGRRFGPQYSTPISGVSIGIAVTLGREAGIIAGR